MTEIIVDENTGLPELPEGYLWQVERHDHQYDGGIYYNKTLEAYMLRIDRVETIEQIVADESDNPSYRWWAKNSQPQTIRTERTVTKEVKTNFLNERIVRIKPIEELTDEQIYTLRTRLNLSIDDLFEAEADWEFKLPADAIEVMDFTLNEQTIRDASVKAFKRFNELLEERRVEELERERKAKLIGEYPPLKLAA